MARYEITAPDGGRFEITAPDGATQEQVLGYARQQFASLDQKTEPQKPDAGRFASPQIGQASPSYAEDITRSAGSGLIKGAVGLASLPGTIEQLGRAGINAAGRAYRGDDADTVSPQNVLPGYKDVRGTVEKNVTGPLYEPQTTPGKFAGAVGEFAPGMLFPGGGAAGLAAQTVNRGVRNVLAPAIASEAAGQLTEGTSVEPVARIGGALVGPLAMTPFRQLNPTRNQSVQTLNNEGVTSLTAGEVTGRKPLRWAESAVQDVPFTGQRGVQMNTEAAEQFTRAALRRAGIDAPRATPDVIDDAFTRIGQVFDAVTRNNSMPVTPQLQNEVSRIALAYERIVPPSMQSGAIRSIADDVHAAGRGGTIPGVTYQGWRSEIDAAARGAQNTHVKQSLYDLRNALDDAFERTLTGGERAAFTEARRHYRNMIVLEQAATGAGEKAASGLISPASLAQATKTYQGRRNYARGNGDFSELARAGVEIMSPLPQSGTAPRLVATELGKAVVGAGIGGSQYGPEGAGAGAMLPVIMQAALGRGLMSRPAQAYMRNQLAAGPAVGISANRSAVVAPSVFPEFSDKRAP